MKHIVVTGASSGIGYAITQLLLTSGYQVTALSRSLGRLADLPAGFHRRVHGLITACNAKTRRWRVFFRLRASCAPRNRQSLPRPRRWRRNTCGGR